MGVSFILGSSWGGHCFAPTFVALYGALFPSSQVHLLLLGPLHTRAKSRDQKKVCKGRPKAPSKSCSVVADPQV